jgi:hypothetical protein
MSDLSFINNVDKEKGMSRLEYLTKELGAYSEFGVLNLSEWPDLSDKFNIKQLEEEAERLPSSLELVFLDGEASDIANIACDYNLHLLNSFLNEVFGGRYHNSIGV